MGVWLAKFSQGTNPTPSVPEFPSLTILSLFIITAFTVLAVYFKKHKHFIPSQTWIKFHNPKNFEWFMKNHA